jgi:hypothetical protein
MIEFNISGFDLTSGSSENEEEVVNKYKALLSEIKEKEKKSNSGTDMEVSWIPNDVVNEKVCVNRTPNTSNRNLKFTKVLKSNV